MVPKIRPYFSVPMCHVNYSLPSHFVLFLSLRIQITFNNTLMGFLHSETHQAPLNYHLQTNYFLKKIKPINPSPKLPFANNFFLTMKVSTLSSSSSSNSLRTKNKTLVECNHKVPSKLKVVKSGVNAGKKFYGCSHWPVSIYNRISNLCDFSIRVL